MEKVLGNFEALYERMNIPDGSRKLSYEEERAIFLRAKKQMSKGMLKMVVDARKKAGLPID